MMWSLTAFSLVFVYIFLAERMIHLDYLTGTWSRHSFEFFISHRFKGNSTKMLGIIYVDIDGLKQINDAHGHAEGDEALKTAVNIIKRIVRKSDIVARLGGDEFAVVLNIEGVSKDMLENTIRRIDSALTEYNDGSGKPYALQCSFGADMFSPGDSSLEEFMHGIDTMMYRSKRQKKQD
jgi:diguanylate cyclase (GGDEF)-like protein